MIPVDRGNGYQSVGLYLNGERHTCLLHKIIMLAEYGFIPKDMQVDHINKNKSDNRISNLQILSHAENSRKNNCKLNKLNIEDIKSLFNYFNVSVKTISEMFIVDVKTIYNIINGSYDWMFYDKN